ncbi:MAG: acylphosphatase [Parcubacteria group bacterium]|nr:acylphosphatase [Parcubacteria group bacterium]
MQQQMECVVRGRVQRVMFRDFVWRHARRLRLVGRVHNRKDGSVLVVAEGDEESLQKLRARLHRGPLLARVDAVEVRLGPATGQFTNFSIAH